MTSTSGAQAVAKTSVTMRITKENQAGAAVNVSRHPRPLFGGPSVLDVFEVATAATQQSTPVGCTIHVLGAANTLPQT